MTTIESGAPRGRDGVAGALFVLTDRLFRANTLNEVYDASLDAIRELLGCERASILLFDPAGVMRFVSWRGLSDEYRGAVDGHSPWTAGQRNADPIFVADIRETDEPEWLKQRLKSEGIAGLAFVPLFANGRVVGKFMTYFPTRRDFSDSDREIAITIARQVGFSLERYNSEAARLEAVRKLKESEERFRLMSEDAPIMIWVSDREGRCLQLNEPLRVFWGVETVQGFDWTSTLHPQDRAVVTGAVKEAILAKSTVHVKGRFRRHDGAYRIFEAAARPYFASSGEFEGMVGVNVDITEKEEADQHKRLLINELNHRVKNTLAVVQAVAGQTFRSDAPRNVQQQVFEGRLMALAQAHNLLSAESWQSASLEQVARSSVNGDADTRIQLRGPHVTLKPKQAVTTAMAVHELYTNAVKHGSLRTADGSVAFEWRLVTNPALALVMRWEENGTLPVTSPTHRGFGMTMIEQALAAELNGEVEMNYLPSGLVCTVTARLPPTGDAS